MNASGINTGTSGNLSARIDGGMLITPSAVDYNVMHPADLVIVSTAGQWAEGARPSSEWRFHRDIYAAYPEAEAIVHAHPVHCVALAALHRPIPAYHYMVAIAGGADIRCADYATFGTQELSDRVVEALAGRRACLMANHGLVCYGESPADALALAIEVEHLAHGYCTALGAGVPAVLDDEEMGRVIERFRKYRAGVIDLQS